VSDFSRKSLGKKYRPPSKKSSRKTVRKAMTSAKRTGVGTAHQHTMDRYRATLKHRKPRKRK
jgi:hypothetical protein